MKSHPFRHWRTITKHRHQVIRNASRMGIFWFSLHHDLSKYSRREFWTSAKYYKGTSSPVFEERLNNNGFSSICQHHTKRNPHHWEYWTDFFMGRLIAKTMPYKWACEYVADMLAASKVYNGESFEKDTTLKYWNVRKNSYYMTSATKEFIEWALTQYAESEWKNLKKKSTKAKYLDIVSKHRDVEIFDVLDTERPMPNLERRVAK